MDRPPEQPDQPEPEPDQPEPDQPEPELLQNGDDPGDHEDPGAEQLGLF